MNRGRATPLLLTLIVLVAGCAHYPENERLAGDAPGAGYRFPAMIEDKLDPADALFICLSFSGGGTRAAAFAYGALLALRNTDLARGGQPRNLLDEVDCIAGISGGAFTAAYYGLFGAQTFNDFYGGFLARDIEKELALRAASPINLIRLASPYFSRIDLAAELYNETVFRGKTFATLAERRRPFVILHATNMANGARFEFTQDEFDFLGSDLASFPVARAVAASSAFPILLSPVTLRSFPKGNGFALPTDVKNALEDRDVNMARYYWARHRVDLLTDTQKWIHLLDGGLADNIGLRSILNAYDRGFIRQRINAGHIKRLVILAVNARTDPPEHLSQSERPPGLVDVFMKTATVAMENLSFDTLDYAVSRQTEREQAQTDIRVCNERLAACGGRPLPTLAQEIRTCFVEIDFEALPPADRDWFLSLPTRFALPEATVQKLVDAGKDLLEESRDFQKLLRALRGEAVPGAGVGEKGNCS